jgi:hypothetical protein
VTGKIKVKIDTKSTSKLKLGIPIKDLSDSLPANWAHSKSKFISPRQHWTANPMIWTTGIYFIYKKSWCSSGQAYSKISSPAPSINWLWAWEHSGMVDRTFRRGIHFTQTPLDYKSDDLDYRLLQEHYKKAVRSQKIS